jgi:hypothetical protein
MSQINRSAMENKNELWTEGAHLRAPDCVFKRSRGLRLRGVFLLHGSEHELAVQVHGELCSGRWQGTAKLEVPYLRFAVSTSDFIRG